MKTLNPNLKFEYINNCAVLLEIDGMKVLCDGLISDNTPFDKMPKDIEKQIIDGEGEYSDLKGMLFSHCHNDHFSGYKLTRYLERNHGAYVAVPEIARLDWDYLWDLGANVLRLEGAVGGVRTRDFDGLSFEYMKTAHLTFNYPEHFIFNLLGKDTNVILTADMDLLNMELLERITRKEHSYLFISNIMLWHKEWREYIDALGFEKVFIYHVPDEGNDVYGYRRKAMRLWERYKDKYPNWEVLNLDEIH